MKRNAWNVHGGGTGGYRVVLVDATGRLVVSAGTYPSHGAADDVCTFLNARRGS